LTASVATMAGAMNTPLRESFFLASSSPLIASSEA
jgi:hypothetical protein